MIAGPLWCYDDYCGWGPELHAAATARGIDARMFTADEAETVEGGLAVVHLNQNREVARRDKRVAKIVGKRVRMIPTLKEALFYDDKLKQRRALADYLPETWVFTDEHEARRFTKRGPFPLVSKSSRGAGSNNVRLLETPEQARMEAFRVFRGGGLPERYGLRQEGYVYWQKFCPGNDGDLRIIRVGRQTIALRRGNRDSRPMASGSGNLFFADPADPALAAPVALAWKFFERFGFRFCGIDLIRDGDAWRILEMTCGWTLAAYGWSVFRPDGRLGTEFWDVFLDEVEAGAL